MVSFALLYDCTIYDGSLFISTFKKLEQRDMMVEKEILFKASLVRYAKTKNS